MGLLQMVADISLAYKIFGTGVLLYREILFFYLTIVQI